MKTLIIVDAQNDFMPGGALAVPRGNEIIPIINTLSSKLDHVVATLDWHPLNHISFATYHGKKVGEMVKVDQIEQCLWPDHCIQNTHGSSLAPDLNQNAIQMFFHKGSNPRVDSYSAFFDAAKGRSTGLEEYLRKNNCSELYFAGLATDYCVLYSVLDALSLGFSVTVVEDACRPINLRPDDEQNAYQEMKKKGAVIKTSRHLI